MYNFLFPFLFSSSSLVINLSLLVFLHLSASSFAAAAKASSSSSPLSLSLFFLQTPLKPNKLATMPPAKKDQNANTNTSISESTATIQVPLTMTREQTDLIFELTRRKLEAEMAAAEVEARLRRELMVKKSEARVAASVAAAPARRPMADEEDYITDEVPPKVMSITLRFAGLPQEEIVRIFQNKFKPINLYRLHHIRGLRFDSLHDQDRIDIEDGILKLRKTSGICKDFGKSFYEVWADAFHNYTTILVSLLGREIPDLHSALAEFYTNICELFTMYEWQEAVLPMAIEAHTFIVAKQPTDPLKWVIPEKFQPRETSPRIAKAQWSQSSE